MPHFGTLLQKGFWTNWSTPGPEFAQHRQYQWLRDWRWRSSVAWLLPAEDPGIHGGH
jgi:hypothetical protein